MNSLRNKVNPMWIGGARTVTLEKCPAFYVGRKFELDSVPGNVVFKVAAAGWIEVCVNGVKAGDEVLFPVTCQPDKRISEVVIGITPYLKAGENEITVLLGNGWWTQLTGNVWGFDRAAWHDREVWEDGSCAPLIMGEVIADGNLLFVTDDSWRAWDSPIVFNQFRSGEYYDARLGLCRHNERAPFVAAWGPVAAIKQDDSVPCRVFECGGPVREIKAAEGIIYDFGHNISGWCEIEVQGKSGARLLLDYDESLNETSTDLKHLVHGLGGPSRGEPQIDHDEYILRGGDTPEKWHPRFTYHGFRYLQVRIEGEAELKSVRQCFVHSDFESTGSISTSDPLFRRLHEGTLRSFLSNFAGIPTDCPHREKNGWTGDAQLACETGLWNFRSADGYRHFTRMMIDSQAPNGAVPCILPYTHRFGLGWGSGPAWDAVLFTMPREIFRFTGDDSLAREAYPAMKKYLEFAAWRKESDGLFNYGLGDWCSPVDTAGTNITDSAIVWSFYRDLAFWAERFGEGEVARDALAECEQIRRDFNAKFYKGDGIFENGSLTALSVPLYFRGLCDEAAEQKTLQKLVEKVRECGHKCNFGILGAKWVPRVLSEYGYTDDAWKIFTQRENPGYQWWFDQGEDTLWETFDGNASHNHIMFGDLSAWAYEYVAGIKIVEPGFAKVEFKPHLPEGVDSFEATYDSPRGKISVVLRSGMDPVCKISE